MSLTRESPKEIADAAAGIKNSLTRRSGIFYPDIAVEEIMRSKGRGRIIMLLRPLASSEVTLHINSALKQLNRSQTEEFIDAWSEMFVGEFASMVAHSAFSSNSGISRLNKVSVWDTRTIVARSKLDTDSTLLLPINYTHIFPDIYDEQLSDNNLDLVREQDRELAQMIAEHFSQGLRSEYFLQTPDGLSQLTPVWNIIYRYVTGDFVPYILENGRLFNDSWKELVRTQMPALKRSARNYVGEIEKKWGI